MTTAQSSLTALDHPNVSARLFHPRKDPVGIPLGPGHDISITVSSNVEINGRFHWTRPADPTILFFHGNGEIVSDYDDLGPLYNAMGINFLVVDYRGYGRSTGTPTVSAMMQDCHTILNFSLNWLQTQKAVGPFIIMGRSLGSASVLELAADRQQDIDGLIIESGFAYAEPLLRLLGIMPETIGFIETEGFRNIDKIKKVTKPTLIIHAEHDHIIPFTDGQDLLDASPAADKQLLKIPGANHNDIFLRGRDLYFNAIRDFISRIKNS